MKKASKSTMRDLAARLGISHSTVSRALHDDPRITAEVCKQLTKVAQKVRYKRNPQVSEMMTHLRTRKHRIFQGTLAWITNLNPAGRDMATIQQQFSPAAEECAGQATRQLARSFDSAQDGWKARWAIVSASSPRLRAPPLYSPLVGNVRVWPFAGIVTV